MADTTPSHNDDFGFHHELQDVQLAVFGVENWHVLPFPGGLFEQPETLIWDMVRYINLRDAVRDPNNPVIYATPDVHQEQPPTKVKKTIL